MKIGQDFGFELVKNTPASPPPKTGVQGTGVWRLTVVSILDTVTFNLSLRCCDCHLLKIQSGNLCK